jgi:glucose dehydrogenase
VAVCFSVGRMADRQRDRYKRTEGASALPERYYLDESDPDVLILRRQDGTFVAAFSAQGASSEGIGEAAKEDYYVALISEQIRGGYDEPDPAGTRG